jgi:hypothetical protein
MVSTASLWLPILLAALGVFIASSLIHMVFKWHNADYLKLGNEDQVRAAIGKPAPGVYVVPHCLDMKEMQSPQMQQKFVDGPVGFVVVRPSGLPKMGGHLAKWFALNVVVAALAAHLAAVSVPVGAGREAFHLVAIVTLLAYSAGSVSDGIWFGRPWRAVAKELLDALIFAVVSGAVFGWLWPGA